MASFPLRGIATVVVLISFLLAPFLSTTAIWAQESSVLQESAKADAPKTDAKKEASEIAATTSTAATSSTSTAAKSKAAAAAKHIALLKDSKDHPGLIHVYQKGNKLYAELTAANYSSEYIVLISIARGISHGSILGGMSWGFGDDWIWKFRKIDDRVHIIRRNVRFKANTGSPAASAVKNAYTDSVLFSLPVLSKGPKGGDLIDLTSVFMSDLPQIGQSLPGFAFSSTKSSWNAIKSFKNNLELEVAATYSSSGRSNFDSVPDSRGATIHVHYSISKVPQTGYQSRLADDRVGYFLTVIKDYSKKSDRNRFHRYINRWHLAKAESGEDLSPPKEPIIFYIEKTVPFKYRKPIREGIEEWNKAFEKAGFVNAIEVRQQQKEDEWDPEDINYNTFRWITASAGFAMGPSRVNPYTGQILDADIIFDADFLQFWKDEYETLTQETIASMTGGSLDPADYAKPKSQMLFPRNNHFGDCLLSRGMSRQLAFGASAIVTRADPKQAAIEKEKLIVQGLKEVTMHEVGHTLGLRHNFKASKYLSLKDLNDPAKNKNGSVASVMDYSPTNIVPKGWKQGNYYTDTIGPYDYWAIEYGYKPLSGGTTGEAKELKKIASRSGEPALAYATDEDTRGFSPDPDTNRFDLGDDALEYAKTQAQLVNELMPKLVERMSKDGEDYTQVRRAFNILISQHGQSMYFAARYIGGMHISRSHKGDKDAKPPLATVDAAKQREALKLLDEQVFSDKSYTFSPDIYQYLASSNWQHWGSSSSLQKDFPVHSVVSMWRSRITDLLLSSTNLQRIHDAELKIPADKDAFTTAELIEKLTKSIFSEVDTVKAGNFTNRKPAISSLRRDLQRGYLRKISSLAMGRTSAPDDCQTIAFAELASLNARIDQMLKGKVKLDSYSRAHLQESSSRIKKVLEAKLLLSSP